MITLFTYCKDCGDTVQSFLENGVIKVGRCPRCPVQGPVGEPTIDMKDLQNEIVSIKDTLNGWLERKDNFLSSTVGYEMVRALRDLSEKIITDRHITELSSLTERLEAYIQNACLEDREVFDIASKLRQLLA